MNQIEFEKLVKETMDDINKLLVIKGGEYAGSEDRLANFKRGAALVGVTPLQTLFIYLSKHYDAVATFVRDDAAGIERPRSEAIEGRLDDLINYGLLAKALIRDKSSGHNNATKGPDYPCGLSSPVSSEELNAQTGLIFPRWMKEHHDLNKTMRELGELSKLREKVELERQEGEMIFELVQEGKLIPLLDESGNFSGYKLDQRESESQATETRNAIDEAIMMREERS